MIKIKQCLFSEIASLRKAAKAESVTLKDHPKQLYWGAFIEGNPVACAALHLQTPNICVLKSAFVLPEFRGRGIGKRLVDARIYHCDRCGYKRVKTLSLKPKLFEVRGFKCTAIRDTSFVHVHHMALEFCDGD